MVDIVVLKETKTTNTHAGTFTADNWVTRSLNVIESNPGATWVSLNSLNGQFTLKTGKYLVVAKAPAVGVGTHQTRINNITDNIISYGESTLSYSLAPTNTSFSSLYTVFTISAIKTFAFEHRCIKGVENFGLGYATGFAGNTEVYAEVAITKF